MNQNWMLLPVLVNFVLVFIVQMVMYRQRVGTMKRERIHPQKVAHRHQLEEQVPGATASSNNFKNQFEMPVIFYATVAFFMISGWAGWLDFYLACGFVIMRIIHAAIHLTSNRVIHRFKSYIVSSFVLWALVVSLIASWVQHLL